jgi:NAD(P)-dependent dehydrogenase (short-subunit alcohol dehydrogenase family)
MTMDTAGRSLQNRVALVTGGSRGIGAAIARALAAHGAHVVVASRRIGPCEDLAASIREHGGQASAVACHVGELAQIEAALDAVTGAHGKLDILVNAAAANPYFGPAADTPVEAFQKTVDVNLRGAFYLTAGAARRMHGTGGGAIVNVASIAGVVPGPNQGLYSMTKAAMISMTKVFAAECAPWNVRVNALLPGITDTRFAAALVHDEALRGQYLERVPLGRVAQPEEMAGAVLYLVSPGASYTTGVCLPVDGGWLVN